MRLLVISGAFVPAPIAEADHIYHTCIALARRGVDVHVLTTAGPDGAVFPEFTVMPIMHRWSWRGLATLAGAIRTVRPDAVLLQFLPNLFAFSTMILFVGNVVRLIRPRATFGVLFYNIGTGSGLGALKKWLVRYLGRYKYGTLLTASTAVFYGSEPHAARLRTLHRGITSKLIYRPHPPVLLMSNLPAAEARAEGRRLAACDDDQFLIAYFGRVYPGKGIDTLIAAFALLASLYPHARLLLIGGALDTEDARGHANAIDEQINSEGLDDRVVRTGEYPWNSDRGSLLLHAADLCVLPLDHGVSPANSSLAAAAAHGLPMVVTETGDQERLLVDEENVISCPPKDAEALAGAIQRVIDEPDLRGRLSRGSTALVRDHLSEAVATDRIVDAMFREPIPRPSTSMPGAGRS